MKCQWSAPFAVLAFSAAGFGLAAGDARTQNYPNKPIINISPFGPGSGNDVVARIIAQKVSENWIQPVVVDNRPGASGGIGLVATAKAPPDGYTIVMASTSQILNQFVSKVRYDIVKDFAPVSITGSMPYIVAVTNSSPARSMSDLVAIAKSRPGKMNYAAVIGAIPHFMGEMLKSARGLDIMMIPYKSTTDAEVDVITGRVEIWFATMASALPQVKAGKVRILGVPGEKRAAVLPDAPTMTEAGLPTVDVIAGFFILTAAATPKPIVNALNREIVKAIGARDVIDRLAAAGVDPQSSSPEELAALLKSEVARWGKIIKESGIRVD